MKVRTLPLLAVVLLVVVLAGGCQSKVAMQYKQGDLLPSVVPPSAAPQVVVPDGPVAGQVTAVFVKAGGGAWFVHSGTMLNTIYLELPGVKKIPSLKTGYDEQAFLVDGVGISQGENLWLAEPSSYNFDEPGKEHLNFSAGSFLLVPHDKSTTLADAIVAARKDKGIATEAAKSPTGARVTPSVGPELSFYGPITGLTPIKGKKGHYRLEVDVQTDNPELVGTVVLGETRINGLVSN